VGGDAAPAYPPVTERPSEVEAFVAGLSSVLDRGTAIYVSSPLTSGRRAAEWHLQNGRDENPEGFRRHVFALNRADAACFAQELRARTHREVIDPGAVDDLEGWTQNDYRVCWGRVIQEYAKTVVFRDGWQYSNGCAYEFAVAHEAGLEVVTDDWSPLSSADGRALLVAATEDLRSQDASVEFLEGVVASLDAAATAK
jgi:hypothetical protein